LFRFAHIFHRSPGFTSCLGFASYSTACRLIVNERPSIIGFGRCVTGIAAVRNMHSTSATEMLMIISG
jgi:hypothetical protein